MISLEAYNKLFGQLRSLLQQPSHHSWKRLCGHLDLLLRRYNKDQRVQEQMLPYIKSMLARWDTSLMRFAQHNWLERAIRGVDTPHLQYCTAMHLTGLTVFEDEVVQIFDSPYIKEMLFIDLSHASDLGREGVEGIITSPYLTKLQRLDLRRTGVASWQLRELEQACPNVTMIV